MRRILFYVMVVIVSALVVLGGWGISAQNKDKYTVKVPNGLAFSEFRGYESWQVVSISQDGNLFAAVLVTPAPSPAEN